MSLRYEQFNALRKTQEFLRSILTIKGTIKKRELQAMAISCLRHYPFLNANGKPIWSNDDFTTNEGKTTQ